MPIRTLRLAAIATASLLAAPWSASVASAAVMFSFAANVSNVSRAPGQTAPVQIFLVETTTDGSPSVLAAEKGLEFAQVTVSREQAGGASIDSFTPNPAFDDAPFVSTTPASAPFSSVDASLAISFDPTPAGGVTGTTANGVTRVLLLSLVVRAGSAAGVTSFSLADNPAASETLTFGTNGSDGTVLDGRIASGLFTLTTTAAAVPEPATLAALAVGALAARRRRRR